MVYRRCRAILGAEDAADAVSDIFMRVMEKRELFRGESSPSTWLYGMATLHCLQRLRNRERRRGKLELVAQQTPVARVNPLDDHVELLRVLQQQPEQMQLMICLRYIDGLTLEEVSEVVGLSRKTVAQRVNEFVASAREHLDWEPEPS